MTNEEKTLAAVNELLRLLNQEKDSRSNKIRDFIRQERAIDPKFESLACTVLLLWEANNLGYLGSDEDELAE